MDPSGSANSDCQDLGLPLSLSEELPRPLAIGPVAAVWIGAIVRL